MMHPLLSVLIVLVAISIIPTVFSDSLRGEFTIPDWIKNMADWWADGQIDDAAFLHAVEFLINEKIVTVQIPVVESEVVEEVPGWVKNTAGWWAEDKIHDFTFVGAIEYLIGQGIMTVDEKQEAEELPPCPDKMISGYACIVKEVAEVKDFYMEVNGSNCCLNWAHVGKDYRFQIETFDKKHGNQIDGVTITAKIISKDGQLRHHFGMIITEDGIYRNSIAIPSMDWYAGNILSVTAEYNGFEKTIEKEFEVFSARTIQDISYLGVIKSTVEINDSTANGPVLLRSGQETKYGWSAANIGDLDGNGVNDLAVGQAINRSGCHSQVSKGAVQIHFLNVDGTLKSTKEICESTSGITLGNGHTFGSSVAGLGDINDDGVPDIAVGGYLHDTKNRGEVDIILMNSDGSVLNQVRHYHGGAGLGTLGGGTQLGYSVENIGDLNGDGINDIAMGGWNCDCGGANDSGLVIIGFLTSSGGIDSTVNIQRGTTNGPSLTASDAYGTAIANIGDLDGDGVQEIAVGSKNDDGDSGEIHIHYMNTDGSIDSTVELNDNHISQLATTLSMALEGLGDIDGDGVGDMAIGLDESDVTGTDRGGVLLVYLNSDGSVKSTVEFNDSSSNGPTLVDSDLFGTSVANMGDLDGYTKFNIVGNEFRGDLDSNHVIELAVGARGDNMDENGDTAGATNRGAAHILFLK